MTNTASRWTGPARSLVETAVSSERSGQQHSRSHTVQASLSRLLRKRFLDLASRSLLLRRRGLHRPSHAQSTMRLWTLQRIIMDKDCSHMAPLQSQRHRNRMAILYPDHVIGTRLALGTGDSDKGVAVSARAPRGVPAYSRSAITGRRASGPAVITETASALAAVHSDPRAPH